MDDSALMAMVEGSRHLYKDLQLLAHVTFSPGSFNDFVQSRPIHKLHDKVAKIVLSAGVVDCNEVMM